MFCADHKGKGDIFEMRELDRDRGCMVVVRPDQYVAHVLPLDAYEELSEFFGNFLLPVRKVWTPGLSMSALDRIRVAEAIGPR